MVTEPQDSAFQSQRSIIDEPHRYRARWLQGVRGDAQTGHWCFARVRGLQGFARFDGRGALAAGWVRARRVAARPHQRGRRRPCCGGARAAALLRRAVLRSAGGRRQRSQRRHRPGGRERHRGLRFLPQPGAGRRRRPLPARKYQPGRVVDRPQRADRVQRGLFSLAVLGWPARLALVASARPGGKPRRAQLFAAAGRAPDRTAVQRAVRRGVRRHAGPLRQRALPAQRQAGLRELGPDGARRPAGDRPHLQQLRQGDRGLRAQADRSRLALRPVHGRGDHRARARRGPRSPALRRARLLQRVSFRPDFQRRAVPQHRRSADRRDRAGARRRAPQRSVDGHGGGVQRRGTLQRRARRRPPASGRGRVGGRPRSGARRVQNAGAARGGPHGSVHAHRRVREPPRGGRLLPRRRRGVRLLWNEGRRHAAAPSLRPRRRRPGGIPRVARRRTIAGGAGHRSGAAMRNAALALLASALLAPSLRAEDAPVRAGEGGRGLAHLSLMDGVRLRLTGYVDAGFFATQGDGTAYVRDAGKLLHPEYQGVVPWVFLGDPWGNPVNAQGDSADLGLDRTNVPRFDPIQSAGHPSFLVNMVDLGLAASIGESFFFETSIGFEPRQGRLGSSGDQFDVDLAYLEWVPFKAVDLHVFAGKFESTFGIEYRTRKAPDRFGVTPSLISRYTVGTVTGLKVRGGFFDQRVTVNLAVTNGGTFTEKFAHFFNEVDMNGGKTLSGRVSVLLPLPFTAEIGASGEIGAQDEQRQDHRHPAGERLAAVHVHLVEEVGELLGESAAVGHGEIHRDALVEEPASDLEAGHRPHRVAGDERRGDAEAVRRLARAVLDPEGRLELAGEHVQVDRLERHPFQVGEVHVELVSGGAEPSLPGLEADARLEEERLADAGRETQIDHVDEERGVAGGLDGIEARHVGAVEPQVGGVALRVEIGRAHV